MRNARGETLIDTPGPLLGPDGALTCPGYAMSLVLDYRKKDVKAPAWRRKEWDYYLVCDADYAVALTVSDLAYVGLLSASVVDFKNASYKTTSDLLIMPMGKLNLPETSAAGVTAAEGKNSTFRIEVEGGVRRLSCTFKHFDGEEDFSFEAVLDDEPTDTMVIATPWAEKKQAFYYNQKIVGMRACGSFTKGALSHTFSRDDSFGLLDWGRGVWTYDNTWYWAVANGWQDGAGAATPNTHVFGLNLGYGFGDDAAASENMLFVDGVAYKLGRVDFGIPVKDATAKKIVDRYDLLKPWHMTDDEGLLDLTFTPIVDRADWMNYAVILTDQHQVFGVYSGTVMIDGKPFVVDGLIGSAEAVHNKY